MHAGMSAREEGWKAVTAGQRGRANDKENQPKGKGRGGGGRLGVQLTAVVGQSASYP